MWLFDFLKVFVRITDSSVVSRIEHMTAYDF